MNKKYQLIWSLMWFFTGTLGIAAIVKMIIENHYSGLHPLFAAGLTVFCFRFGIRALRRYRGKDDGDESDKTEDEKAGCSGG